MKRAKGDACNIQKTKVFRIVDDNFLAIWKKYGIVVEMPKKKHIFCKNVLTYKNDIQKNKCGVASLSIDFLKTLHIGDIVSLDYQGNAVVLWKSGDEDNLLYLTDFCNSHCIMCPQTAEEENRNFYELSRTVLGLIEDKPKYLCLTGGEPTFIKDKYIEVTTTIKDKFPKIALQVLTNGKNLSDFAFVKKCVLNSPVDTLYAIPLYSGNGALHDKIVGAKGSFEKSIYGILNLYRLYQKIELRIVVTKDNYLDLQNIAHFIYWNFPFVFRIAFMGMETHGMAEENLNDVWIEPIEYMTELKEAVLYLHMRQLNVVVYNLPYCILDEEIRTFSADSISKWKKIFLAECMNCQWSDKCAGIFATSIKIPRGIQNKITNHNK